MYGVFDTAFTHLRQSISTGHPSTTPKPHRLPQIERTLEGRNFGVGDDFTRVHQRVGGATKTRDSFFDSGNTPFEQQPVFYASLVHLLICFQNCINLAKIFALFLFCRVPIIIKSVLVLTFKI